MQGDAAPVHAIDLADHEDAVAASPWIPATAAPSTATSRSRAPASSRRSRSARSRVWPPVVLAPMAGVTNYPFRSLCRRFGAGLYVCEMITARALVEGNRKTLRLASFAPDETPRSLQIYGMRPARPSARRSRALVGEGGRPHRHELRLPGAQGDARAAAAPPSRRSRACSRASCARPCAAPARVPVTIKFRKGIDDEPRHLPRRRPRRRGRGLRGRRAARAHRRAALRRRGRLGRDRASSSRPCARSRCSATATSGKRWDALRMMRATGCDGVIVGRGCLGRPWLFRELADVFDGREPERSADARRRRRDHARARAAASPGSSARTPALRAVPQARGLVHQGLPRQRAPAPAPAARSRRSRSSTRSLVELDPADALPAATPCACRAARAAARSASRCPRATSTSSTTTRRRDPRRRTRPQADSRSGACAGSANTSKRPVRPRIATSGWRTKSVHT